MIRNDTLRCESLELSWIFGRVLDQVFDQVFDHMRADVAGCASDRNGSVLWSCD